MQYIGSRKRLSALFVSVLLAATVTACGSSDSSGALGVEDDITEDITAVDDMDQDPPGAGPTGPGPTGPEHSGSGPHCMMIPDFAAVGNMTVAAEQSGNWTNADTWGGTLPIDGDSVHIPEGIQVRVDDRISARLETVRIDGSLRFATAANTQLNVDTLVSSCPGTLEIGTLNEPVAAEVSARVVFIDDGPVDDTNLIGRGAILIGTTQMHGAAKTHRAIISPQVEQGFSELSLLAAPSGWQVGDQLVITGTVPNDPESDEIRNITEVNGTRISLDRPLDLDHTAPRPDLNVYVANTTRNIEWVSENTELMHRGHMMIMSANVNIQNVRFTELGRTDKTRPLDDFQFLFPDDSAGDDAPATAEIVALGGTNIRGRYAVHFHQVGTDPTSAAALVQGAVVFNGPGWGFVNHSSHVDFVDNVAYGMQGAGFYTEAGDEIGSMRGNIAIRSVNSAFETDHLGAIDPDLRAEFMDYGNDGDGYWLTGNRVSMINNVSAGASAHGIIYWTDGIMEPAGNTASRVTVDVNSLPDGNLIPDRDSVPVWWAPLAENRGNESYGATIGFRSRYIHAKNYLGRDEESDFHRSPPQAYIDTLLPSINNLVVWNNREGVLLNYNEKLSLIDARIIGFGRDNSRFHANPGTAKTGVGLDIGTEATHGPGRVENVVVEGFGAGFIAPVNGQWEIQQLTLTGNDLDMYMQPADSQPTIVNMQGITYTNFENSEEGEENQIPDHINIEN